MYIQIIKIIENIFLDRDRFMHYVNKNKKQKQN